METQFHNLVVEGRKLIESYGSKTIYRPEPRDYVSGEPLAGVEQMQVVAGVLEVTCLGQSRVKRLVTHLVMSNVSFKTTKIPNLRDTWIIESSSSSPTSFTKSEAELLTKVCKHLDYHWEQLFKNVKGNLDK